MTDPRVWHRGHPPPEYQNEIMRRMGLIKRLREADPDTRALIMAHYAASPVDFILDWCWTIDPRKRKLKAMPFCLFDRQVELAKAMHAAIRDEESLLIEKTRDMGASWAACCILVWAWLFIPDANLGIGSRKEILVDRLGDRSTLMEKCRFLIRQLPKDLFWPAGFNEKDHMVYMRLINPATGSAIIGEAGAGIGRGGRYLAYVVDESDFLDDQDAAEASLGDATRTRIDISSVNGTGTLFHRRQMGGIVWPETEPGRCRVFFMDWTDHPEKTEQWYQQRKADAERKGTLHLFAQEVDRDRSASVANALIPGAWVTSAINAHEKLGITPSGICESAMDVADGGGDVNAQAIRHGILLVSLDAKGGEADQVAREFYQSAHQHGVARWWFETNGVGAGARAGANTVKGKAPILAWNPSAAVVNPAGCIHTGETGPGIERRNRDHYANANAQAWWDLRERFRKTHQAITSAVFKYDPDELISLPQTLPNLQRLRGELSQPTWRYNGAGKIIVDKGDPSPNLADAVKIVFAQKPLQVAQDSAHDIGVAAPGAAMGHVIGVA